MMRGSVKNSQKWRLRIVTKNKSKNAVGVMCGYNNNRSRVMRKKRFLWFPVLNLCEIVKNNHKIIRESRLEGRLIVGVVVGVKLRVQ